MFFLCNNIVNAQEKAHLKVSYQSSQFIYLRFIDYSDYLAGDTLYHTVDELIVPALVIKYVSASSAASYSITDKTINDGEVFFKYLKASSKSGQTEDNLKDNKSLREEKVYFNDSLPTPQVKKYDKEKNIFGRVSLQSYSNFSNSSTDTPDQTWRALFSLNSTDKTGKISFSTYSVLIKNSLSPKFGQIKIYDLSLKYKFNESTNIVVGRNINKRLANINTVDGLQFETKLNSYLFGFFVGSRPDFNTYGINLKLMSFGGFVSRADQFKNSKIENTLSIIEQENNFKTDRRFMYYQSKYFNSKYKIRFILSTEWELFGIKDHSKQSTFSFSNLYLLLSFDPFKWLSSSVFYDSRNQIILYETYENLSERLLESDGIETSRKNMNWNVSIRPITYLSMYFKYGLGTQQNDIKLSKNYSGSVSYSKVPFVNAGVSFNASRYTTSYSAGKVYGVTINKNLLSSQLNLSSGYRFAEYDYIQNASTRQHVFSTNLFYTLSRKYIITLSYEGIYEQDRNFTRVLLDFTYRF